MRAADKAAAIRLESTDSKEFTAEPQVAPSRVPAPSTGMSSSRIAKAILICDSDPIRRGNQVAHFSRFGNEVFSRNPLADYRTDEFDRTLSRVSLIRFDCSKLNSAAFKMLVQICDYRQQHGMQPFLVCTGADEEGHFKARLSRLLHVDLTLAGDGFGEGELLLRGNTRFPRERWGSRSFIVGGWAKPFAPSERRYSWQMCLTGNSSNRCLFLCMNASRWIALLGEKHRRVQRNGLHH